MPTKWKCPPSRPIRITTAVMEVILVVLIGLFGQGSQIGGTATLFAVIFVPLFAYLTAAFRWQWLERKYAPEQYHYRIIFWLSLAGAFVLLYFLFFHVSESNDN